MIVHSQAHTARAIGFRVERCRWSSFSPLITISAMVKPLCRVNGEVEGWRDGLGAA